MKIIAVTTWFPSPQAPTMGTFVEKDIRVLALDHDIEVVHLIAPHLADPREADVDTIDHDGLRVHRIVMSPQRPGQIRRARRLLDPLLAGADLVHTMAFPTLLPFARSRPSAPWVHTEHWSGLTTPATLPATWRLALPVLRPLLGRPDVATAVCDFLARPIRTERRGRSTAIVPCIVPAPAALAPRRPVRDRALELVSVGGLIDRKDPLLAVRTLAELGRRGCDVRLTWAGSGPLRDDMLALAAAQGVGDRLTLLGSVDIDGVRAALDAADLFFLPTKADNFCVSAAEALVHGRPVVVGATGGQGEYIDASVGELVDRQDVRAYADAIERVVRRTAELSAEEVAATVGDRFSPQTVRAGYRDVYDLARSERGR